MLKLLDKFVIPAKAGIQDARFASSRIRGNDGRFRLKDVSVLDNREQGKKSALDVFVQKKELNEIGVSIYSFDRNLLYYYHCAPFGILQ